MSDGQRDDDKDERIGHVRPGHLDLVPPDQVDTVRAPLVCYEPDLLLDAAAPSPMLQERNERQNIVGSGPVGRSSWRSTGNSVRR